jgi:hypothetical protein
MKIYGLNTGPRKNRRDSGSGLIVVILVMAFLVTVGIALISVTSIGSRVAGNVRSQQQAFNAAEAGFNAAWIAVENSFVAESWVDFDGHYLVDPTGIDIPLDTNYFRKLTDVQLLDLLDPDGNGTPDYGNIISFKQEYVPAAGGGGTDPRFTYTAFLIDDEAGVGTPDPYDALLVCVGTAGTGPEMTTSRLEILLAVEIE